MTDPLLEALQTSGENLEKAYRREFRIKEEYDRLRDSHDEMVAALEAHQRQHGTDCPCIACGLAKPALAKAKKAP